MESSKRRKIDLTNTRSGLLFLAKLAKSGKRFDYMYTHMKSLVQVVTPDEPLTSEERTVFISACCCHLKSRRKAYKFVSQVAAESSGVDQPRTEAAMDYLSLLASEIRAICMDFVGVIDLHLLPSTNGPQSSVGDLITYKILKGVFLLVVADVMRGAEKQSNANAAIECVESAKEDGKDLPASSSARLNLQFRLALLQKNKHEGYKIAKQAYDDCEKELNLSGEPILEDVRETLQNLRDFLNAHKMYAS